jgi:hypothetical protein
MNLTPNHPALVEGRTIHPKTVKDLSSYPNDVFKSASENKKLGNGNSIIVKGKWRGMPMYSLTLEERKTCPQTCLHWRDCYGNGMGFAHRFPAGKELEDRIEAELALLSLKHKRGFVVRLHVLGDFYSLEYVSLWARMMQKHANLHVFGFTARDWPQLWGILAKYPFRWYVRKSVKVSNSAFTATSEPSERSITCPQQTGKTESCLTCGLCWSVNLPIHFQTH